MAGLAAAVIFCLITVLLMVGVSRRRQYGEYRAFIVIPYLGDIKALEGSVRAYNFEEMLESAEYRRIILIACPEGRECELSIIARKYPSVMIVNESQLGSTVFGSIKNMEKGRSDVATANDKW
ncbi:MAG: hypothetical protein IJ871_10490 [Ruminococcus sp.]|nr:hypothetical protein [Ruminococcus sp.]